MKVQVDITFNVEPTTGVVDSVTFSTPHFRNYPLQPSIELMLLAALLEIARASPAGSRPNQLARAAITKAEEMAGKDGEHGIKQN